MSELLDSLAGAFDTLPQREAAGLGVLRRDALAGALRVGLPGARAERWKYTSLRALERRRFVPAASPALPDDLALPATPRIVFVNGRLDATRTDLSGLPFGMRVLPLSDALASDAGIADAFLAPRFTAGDEVFAQLNTALAVEGAVVRVESCAPTVTLHVVHVGHAGEGDQAWHLRNVIDLQPGACLHLVEHHIGATPHAHFANAVTRIHIGKGASLVHARLQDEPATATSLLRTEAVLDEDAGYRRLDIELGAGLSRHELNVSLRGAGARLDANGALLGDGRRVVDTRLGIDHAVPGTSCELTWRGLANERSRVVFHGGITIREGADGTDAALSCKNLLLSAQAEIDAQPVLEIYADEVKAAHGATVGNLDTNALFYLRSRGLPEAQARALLTAAFLSEPLAVLPQEQRDLLLPVLDAALQRSVAKATA